MILSSLTVAGALTTGTVGASVKVYHEQKRRKEQPWTVVAKKMTRRPLPLANTLTRYNIMKG